MTAERSRTSSKTLGESSTRSVEEDDGDSTLTVAFTLRVHRIPGKLRRCEGNKETFLKERSVEVEEQLGLKTAIGTSLVSGNPFNDF